MNTSSVFLPSLQSLTGKTNRNGMNIFDMSWQKTNTVWYTVAWHSVAVDEMKKNKCIGCSIILTNSIA